jgi:hypothetical protein
MSFWLNHNEQKKTFLSRYLDSLWAAALASALDTSSFVFQAHPE